MHTEYNELKYLTFARFIFHTRALNRFRLPIYKGSTFRGGFGNNLKRTVCINRNGDCGNCILQPKCVYSYVFETRPLQDSRVKIDLTDVPRPYVLVPPDTGKDVFDAEEPFEFSMALFGKAIDYLPYVLFVFQQLGEHGIGRERGRFYIESVKNERFGDEIEIFNAKTGCLKGNIHIYSSENFLYLYENLIAMNPKTMRIEFVTPFRMKIDGHLRDDFTFFDFFRSLLNRLYFIARFHCGGDNERRQRELLELSKGVEITGRNLRWHDWIRYSSRQKTEMYMGGVVGDFTISGNLVPFMPFLKVGEYTHTGKATSMGLGRYSISVK
ncbi:MAG: CRISPR system precrRNA processing endoribonuclease RAMP protein Cas6 [Nitrospirota bacterium]